MAIDSKWEWLKRVVLNSEKPFNLEQVTDPVESLVYLAMQVVRP